LLVPRRLVSRVEPCSSLDRPRLPRSGPLVLSKLVTCRYLPNEFARGGSIDFDVVAVMAIALSGQSAQSGCGSTFLTLRLVLRGGMAPSYDMVYNFLIQLWQGDLTTENTHITHTREHGEAHDEECEEARTGEAPVLEAGHSSVGCHCTWCWSGPPLSFRLEWDIAEEGVLCWQDFEAFVLSLLGRA